MWGLEWPPGISNHIGFPHWRQLNAANPEEEVNEEETD